MFIEVTRFNLTNAIQHIQSLLTCCDFVAMDTEFTGLGRSEDTRSKNMEIRYSALKNTVETHAIVSLGLSLFHHGNKVTNFHFTFQSQIPHLVCPQSIRFLVEHEFDFNQQYRNGIPYYPGDNVMNHEDANQTLQFCHFFYQLTQSGKLLVVHNGLLDLMFLYHSFFASLPNNLATFVANLSDLFKGGIVDTKFISEYLFRDDASFLSYLFRKCERIDQCPIIIDNPVISNDTIEEQQYVSQTDICDQYAAFGFCKLSHSCPKSHDLDLILDKHLQKKRKRHTILPPKTTSLLSKETIRKNIEPGFETYHSAFFDSFMTGYIFFCRQSNFSADQYLNKVYLIGKDMPLLIQSSKFQKTSLNHDLKMKKIKLESMALKQ